MASTRPVVLFGYDSSTFVLKARLALRLKQIPYTFVTVPSMMPRPLLRSTFGLTYRKIPVLALGRDIYCDTSIICDALEHHFPSSQGYGALYPEDGAEAATLRPLIRGFASYWTDRPLFRIMCGLIPGRVWRTRFGRDRAGLIGHTLDPDKLERKIPENLTRLDQQLSMLEPRFAQRLSSDRQRSQVWVFPTTAPSLADIALFYELSWGRDIAAGRNLADLTGGEEADVELPGVAAVFNKRRYPGLWAWYDAVEQHFAGLPCTETKDPPWETVLQGIREAAEMDHDSLLLPTSRPRLEDLDTHVGLLHGARVRVAPDDTGRDDPTIGALLGASPEEVVIEPETIPGEEKAKVQARVHFPRLGFVIRPMSASVKL